MFADGRPPVLEISGRLNENPEEQGYGFLKVATMLQQLKGDFHDLDLNTEGVLVKLLGGEVKAERVSGRKRPSMLCRTLFGGEQMVRHYEDETFNLWGSVAITFESLLEDAEQGDEDAMERVATAFLHGDMELDIGKDVYSAAIWFEKLAEMNHASAQFQTASAYLEGNGVDADAEKALCNIYIAASMEDALEGVAADEGGAHRTGHRALAANLDPLDVGHLVAGIPVLRLGGADELPAAVGGHPP